MRFEDVLRDVEFHQFVPICLGKYMFNAYGLYAISQDCDTDVFETIHCAAGYGRWVNVY